MPSALAHPALCPAAALLRRSITSSLKPSSFSYSSPSQHHLPPTPLSPPISSTSPPSPTLEAPPAAAPHPMMDRCLLVLCGKSAEEKRLAESLKERKGLRLLDRDSGEEIETRLLLQSDEGEDGGDPAGTFMARSYMDALRARRFGRLVIWTPLITSTHDLLHQNFSELPMGTVCLADAQCKGRGRVKNVWESPAGCLMISYTVQMSNGRVLPLLQYVVSLAVTEAVKYICRQRGLPHLDLKIKWPNDIYLNGLKVAGISCNSTYRSGNFNISAGVGLNLDNEKPTTCLNAALQELTSASVRIKREEILSAFFNKFEDLFEVFLNQGFEALEDLYYNTWLHSDQKVTIEEKNEEQFVEHIYVTIQGLSPSGYLLAIDDDNNSYELHPDGNSFDFFKGLVRRKLC